MNSPEDITSNQITFAHYVKLKKAFKEMSSQNIILIDVDLLQVKLKSLGNEFNEEFVKLLIQRFAYPDENGMINLDAFFKNILKSCSDKLISDAFDKQEIEKPKKSRSMKIQVQPASEDSFDLETNRIGEEQESLMDQMTTLKSPIIPIKKMMTESTTALDDKEFKQIRLAVNDHTSSPMNKHEIQEDSKFPGSDVSISKSKFSSNERQITQRIFNDEEQLEEERRIKETLEQGIRSYFHKSIIRKDEKQVRIFKLLAQESDLLVPKEIRSSIYQFYDISNDNNLIHYDRRKNISLWSLQSHSQLMSTSMPEVTCIHQGFSFESDSDTFFLGFQNGSLQDFDMKSLKKCDQHRYPNIGSAVTSIVTSPKICCYSSVQGKLICYMFKQDNEDKNINKGFILHEGQHQGETQHKIVCLTISVQANFLYGIQDCSRGKILAWNLTTRKLHIDKELQIEDKRAFSDDICKLVLHHEESSLIFTRACSKRGVQILALDDAQEPKLIPDMHSQPINQLLIKYDNASMKSYLITCSKDTLVKVWDWTNGVHQPMATLASHEDEVTCMALTRDKNQSILFSGSLDKRVVAYHTSKYQMLFDIKFGDPLRTLKLTNDSEILVALVKGQKKHGKIKTLRLEQIEIENLDSLKLNLPKGINTNIDIQISNDSKYFVYVIDKQYEVWSINDQTCVQKISFQFNENDASFVISPDSRYLFYTSKFNEVTQIEFKKKDSIATYFNNNRKFNSSLGVSPNGKILLSAGKSGHFCFYQIEFANGNKNKRVKFYGKLRLKRKFRVSQFMHGDSGNRKCVSLTLCNQIFLIDALKCQVLQCIFFPQKQLDIRDIAITLDNKNFICVGREKEQNIMLQIDAERMEQGVKDHRKIIKKLNTEHTQCPFKCQILIDGKYMITSSAQESIILDLREMEPVSSSDFKIICLYSANRISKSFIHEGIYKKCKLENLLNYFRHSAKQKALEEINSSENAEKHKTTVSVYGKFNKIYSKILKNMIDGKTQQQQMNYLDAILGNFLSPTKLNLLHYFAYHANAVCLEYVFQNKIKYTEDDNGRTPLEYTMSRKSYECTNLILKNIMKDRNIVKMIKQEEITQLIEFSPSNLELFFQNMVVFDDELPNFGVINDGKDLIIRTSKKERLTFYKQGTSHKKKDISFVSQMIIVKDQDENEPIQFKRIAMALNFIPGSYESIQFHEALANTKSKGIFKTEAIKMIVKYKWDQNRLIMTVVSSSDLFIFLTFSVMAQPIIFNNNDIFWPLFYLFVIQGCTQTIFELIQMKSSPNIKSYLLDIWNVSDMMKCGAIWYYVIDMFQSKDTHNSPKMTASLNFLMFFKMFQGLSQIRQFRFLIKLVSEVAKDLVCFAGFQLLAMILFGTTLFLLSIQKKPDLEDEEKLLSVQQVSVLESLAIYYCVSLGDFNTDDFDLKDWFLFVLASVLLQIVMLNLLIAILSDTYERVIHENEETDGIALNELILDVESLRLNNRTKSQKSFLHWVEVKTEENQVWSGRVQKLSGVMSQTEKIIVKTVREMFTESEKKIQPNLHKIQSQQQQSSNAQSKKFQNVQMEISKMREQQEKQFENLSDKLSSKKQKDEKVKEELGTLQQNYLIQCGIINRGQQEVVKMKKDIQELKDQNIGIKSQLDTILSLLQQQSK